MSFSRVQLSVISWTIASIHGILQARILPVHYPQDLPSPVTESGSPTLQADSSPSEPPGMPVYPLTNDCSYSPLSYDSSAITLSCSVSHLLILVRLSSVEQIISILMKQNLINLIICFTEI